jgi:hypothetical protein
LHTVFFIYSNFSKTDEFADSLQKLLELFIPFQFEVLTQFETSKPEKFIFGDRPPTCMLKLRYVHDMFKILEIFACDPVVEML